MVRLYASMVVARLPIGIEGIATVLFLRHEGRSFAVAGAAAGGLALGSALAAPLMARMIDRLGPRVLIWLAVAHATGLTGLIALTLGDASSAAIVIVAFATGCTLPTVSSVLRGAYATLLADQNWLVPSAFALEAVVTEAIFFIGPLTTAALAWLASAAAALALAAVAVVAGTAWFIAELPEEIADKRVPAVEQDWAGALRSTGLRTIVLANLPIGFALGSIEVMLPAFADAHGNRQFAGVLIAIWSVGSALGGILYGARPRMFPLRTMHIAAAALVPVVIGALALADSQAAMALLVIPAGLPIAPLIATRNELAGLVALPGSETEAYTWPLTALVSGVSVGAAVAGALADGPGWRAAVAAGVIASVIGVIITVARRTTLVAPEPRAALT